MTMGGSLRLLVFAIAFSQCAEASDGYNFSSNLFEDVAPLLALFGERVTMQFMSQSMGWADNVILAMLPIGIITAVVSAIRVGGPLWLKAIIGRARENFANAEAELMSSTSNEVCELWNGNDVVRCMGSAPITEFICLLPENVHNSGNDPTIRPKIVASDLDNALAKGYLKRVEPNDQDADSEEASPIRDDESQAEKGQATTPEIIIVRNTLAHAPNISLNCHNMFGRTELRVVAAFGTILQLGVLALSAFVSFYPTKTFLEEGEPIAGYAFYCLAIGTILLVLGILLCAHVVETSSHEIRYRPGLGKKARLIWLQKSKTVSDQSFDSYALFPMDETSLVVTSQRADKESGGTRLALETVVGTVLGLSGFILQYVGLRGMHWSVLVAQLGAIIVMAGLRAWVRRGLVKPLLCERLTPGLELEWFSSQLGNLDTPWLDISQRKTAGSKDWRVMTGGSLPYRRFSGDYDADEESAHDDESALTRINDDSKAHAVAMMRRDLGELADWRGPASAEAIALARSLEITMDALFSDSPAKSFTWLLKALHGDIHFRLDREQNGNWKAFSDEIEAALSLWLYSVNEEEHCTAEQPTKKEISRRTCKDDTWLRAKGLHAKPSLRLLGPYTPGLHRDLSWWMPRDSLSRVLEVEEVEVGTLEVEDHRIVGYQLERGEEQGRASAMSEEVESENLDYGFVSGRTSHGFNKKARQYNHRELANFSFDQAKRNLSENRGVNTSLAFESYTHLESLYAQDMFSAFMWAAAKTLRKPIKGDADLRPDDSSSANAWQSFTLRNDHLSKMAQDIESTGLGRLEEIYMSIITPLSAENKLPQAGAMVELAQQQAKRYEQRGNWQAAGDVYLWLFRTTKRFPQESDIAVRATAIVLEFLRRVTLATRLGEAHYEAHKLRILEALRLALQKELDDGSQEVVSNLMVLYEKQGRGWTSNQPQEFVSFAVKHQEVPDVFKFTDLHHHAQFDDRIRAVVFKEIADAGQEMNPRDIHGWTPLHYAAATGSETAAQSLLQQQVDVNSLDLLEWTPLHYACQHGHTSIILKLLQEGADVNCQGRDRVAPLHCAAMNGHRDVVRMLIEAGANIDALDASGNTPLFWAVYNGQEDLVQDLWTDANKRLRDYNGRTAMHLAAAAGRVEMVQLLANKIGADKEAKDRNGQTPLHRAAECGHEDVILLLTGKSIGANHEPTQNSGCFPLHLAAQGGHESVVRLLIRHFGANKDVGDSMGQQPLHFAAIGGHANMVRLLVNEFGADKEARARYAYTPLHLAAKHGQDAVVRVLIGELKVDKEARSSTGQTPLHVAADFGHESTVRLLVKEFHADVEARDDIDHQPTHVAACRGYTAVLRVLIGELHVDMNAKSGGDETPLHLAAGHGHETSVLMLVKEFNADIEARECAGQTPMHAAAQRGRNSVLRLLANLLHADKEAKNKNGLTLLHLAAQNGYQDTVRMVVKEFKADLEAKDINGQTPLQLVIAERRQKVMPRVLRELGAKS